MIEIFQIRVCKMLNKFWPGKMSFNNNKKYSKVFKDFFNGATFLIFNVWLIDKIALGLIQSVQGILGCKDTSTRSLRNYMNELHGQIILTTNDCFFLTPKLNQYTCNSFVSILGRPPFKKVVDCLKSKMRPGK